MSKKSYPPIQAAFDGFAEVGRLAVMQELMVRLLANKTKEIESSAKAFHVSKTEAAVINHFKARNMLTDDEQNLIEKTRQIRNKILHCEFDTAMQLIERLTGSALPPSGITMMKLPKAGSGVSILKAIEDGLAGASTPIRNVPPEEADLFGLLIEIQHSGGLATAAEKFNESSAVISRLIDETAKEDFERGRSS